MSDWMARPSGRFLIWWLYILATLAFVGIVIGLAQVVDWGVTSLTGSKTAALVVGFAFLVTVVAAFNAWLWTAAGNRYVQAMVRVMRRMEGRNGS